MKTKYKDNKAVVIIPLYKEELTIAELYSISNTIKVLSDWPVVVIAPNRLKNYLGSIINNIVPYVDAVYYGDRYFKSISGYNKLLMKRFFYKSFSNYEFMLIVQTDAIIISDNLEYWCNKNYSYIGAPWFKGMEKPVKPFAFIGVGNGGLSLRRIDDFKQFLSRPRYVPNNLIQYRKRSIINLFKYIYHRYVFAYNFCPLRPRSNEDIFWGMLVSNVFPNFRVPNAIEAALFSFEVAPEHLFELVGNKLPFGCHAWEKYNKSFWKTQLDLPHEL